MQTATPKPPVLVVDLRVAAQLLSLGRTKINQLCNDGELERLHIGRKAVITVVSIHAYVERLTKAV